MGGARRAKDRGGREPHHPQCGGEVTRDTVAGAAERLLNVPGMYLFLAPFDIGSRTLADAANYLIQNGYHRVYDQNAIVETVEFADGRRSMSGPMAVVVDRVAIAGLGDSERTREALVQAMAHAVDAITPQDVVGWFAHTGYPLPAPSS